MPCELVGTGWYASETARDYNTAGDDVIRGIAFRPLWWRSLDTFLRPQHVFIVDSASPLKSNDAAFTSTPFQRVELLINPGHAQNGKTHYCGAMAAIILGLEFALHNDVDMFLYVEQDALLFGNSIVAKTKQALRRKDLVFGASTAKDIQHSFFAANKKGIRHFLSALHAIDYSDNKVSPEHKFMFGASRFLPSKLVGLVSPAPTHLIRNVGLRLFSAVCSISRNYEILPFGYGRERPINFNDDVFYFQQGSALEVAHYKQLIGY
jgi:hypothetical protein